MPKPHTTSDTARDAASHDVPLIVTIAALDAFVDEIVREPVETIALDTEFIPESRYVPQLCLVQVNTGKRTVLIDPLAIETLEPLRALLNGPLVVVHAGAQDLALLAHALGDRPTRLFDTQIAGSFLTRYEQASLADLIRMFLGIVIDKQHTFTRWDNRPLKREQLRYAADDVAHLLPLYRVQREALVARGRMAWVEEECRRALLETPMKWEIDADEQYRRLPKASSLTPRQLAVLRELHRWRDELAREQDQRPSNVIGDHKLVRIAAAVPRTLADLEDIRQLPGGLVRRHGTDLLERVEEGLALPEKLLPPPIRAKQIDRHLTAEDVVHLEALMMVARIVAQSESIAPATLAKKEWLAACLRDGFEACLGPDGPLGGWRAEVLGPVFEKWRTGRLRFGMGADPSTGEPRLMLFDEETGIAEAVGRMDSGEVPPPGSGAARRRRRSRKRSRAKRRSATDGSVESA